MTQRTSFTARTAITISRVFGVVGLSLGFFLGASGVPQPAAAEPILLGDLELPTPAAVGGNPELTTSESFTKVGYRGQRKFRHGFSKGGQGFRGLRFGGHDFAKRRYFGQNFRGHRLGSNGFRKHRFRKRRFFGYRFGGNGFGKHGFKRYY